MKPRIVIASRNEGKIREIQRILGDLGIDWITLRELESWPKLTEDGQTFFENALRKAQALTAFIGLAALADDSGLEVEALGGAPGVRSARYGGEEGNDRLNVRKLLKGMKGVPRTAREARFVCVVALSFPDGDYIWSEGVCAGSIAESPRGKGGFGYDPVFIPEGYDRTFAELPPAEKDSLSHRGKALRALRNQLVENPWMLDRLKG
jgi:XTP/dITP diphosphohydrolase